jgi:hypothetical protein
MPSRASVSFFSAELSEMICAKPQLEPKVIILAAALFRYGKSPKEKLGLT